MTKTIAMSSLLAILATGFAADASAWERSGTLTGPRGTNTVEGSGSCDGGACARDVTKTGAAGRSVNRQGSASCADGRCAGSRTTSGSAGRSWTRSGSISR